MARTKAKAATTSGNNDDVEMKSDTAQAAIPNGKHSLQDTILPDGEVDDEEPNGDFDGFDSDEEEANEEEDGLELDDIDDDSDDDAASDMSMDGGIPIPKGRAISPSAIPFSSTAADPNATTSSVISTDAASAAPGLLHPEKPTPYVPDAGHLLITDPNPLNLPTNAAAREAALTSTARDAAQSLLNHLLTTCPIHSLPVTATSSSGITMTLPPPSFQLPREKKIPVPKPPTKWEQFAARKGIGKNKKGGHASADANGELRSTEGKMVYDEASGEWVPKWGYKGRNKRGEGDWLVEVDEKKEAKAQEPADPRGASRAERKAHIKRNERAQRANERRGRKTGA